MEQVQTAVSLSLPELQALVELFRVAQMRLSTAEQLYYDGLLGRFDNELKAQARDMQETPHLGPAVPLGVETMVAPDVPVDPPIE